MGVFESFGDTTDKASEIGERYIDTSRQYFRLKIFQQITFSITLLLKVLIIGGLGLIGFVFLSFSFAFYLGEVTGSQVTGYAIVGVIYIFLGFIGFLMRSILERKVISRMSKKFFKEI